VLHITKKMSREELVKLFDEIDVDKSGEIDEKELHDALNKHGMRVGRWIDTIDK
jgi:Ca2+-binding EF-hand superfamily protein